MMTNKAENGTKTKSNFRLHVVTIIEEKWKVFSLCFLKDQRLISSSVGGFSRGSKIVGRKRNTYESDFIIKEKTNIYSVCGLRNGNLAYGGFGIIKIWEIKGNNYNNVHTIKQDGITVYKLIELEDGRLISCCYDSTIRIWDNKKNYECTLALQGDNKNFFSILELNNYVLYTGSDGMRVWNSSTFQTIKTIKDICCNSWNASSRLKNNTIVVGKENEIFIIDILSFQFKSLKDKEFGDITSICVLRDDKVIIGNTKGIVILFDLLASQIIKTKQLNFEYGITCLIATEDNKLFASSMSHIFNIYY